MRSISDQSHSPVQRLFFPLSHGQFTRRTRPGKAYCKRVACTPHSEYVEATMRGPRSFGKERTYMLTRRQVVTALTLSALLPAAARAQATKRRMVVGVIRVNPRDVNETFVEPFRRHMASLGWTENDNVEFVFTWADGRNDALPKLAADMVARKVDVIVTFGRPGTIAAQKATATIPIIAMTDNLVASGLVKTMARPGANTTGVSILATELDAKRLEVLRELLPSARRIGVL